MKSVLVFSIILLVFLDTVNCQGYYEVVGPRVIRPNSEYHCAISVLGTSEPTIVSASLQGISHTGRPFQTRDQVIIEPYSSRICKLDVGELEDGEYKLEIRGTKGLSFQNEFPLQFLQKSYSVFIQSDRAVYNPGSKILFRVITLNPQLKPAAEVRNELLHIHISDGDGNRVKEWRKVEATRGVFTGELQLSSSPVLGDWNISVTIHGQTYSKQVLVAQYILPKFIVNITAPQHLTFRDNILSTTISAQYSYGKRVKGEATVTVYPTIYSGVIQPIFQNPVRKVVQLDDEDITVDFDIARDLQLNDEYERIVMIDVTVEERLTGRRQNNSIQVHLHKYDYKMELVKTADYFKPGLKYTAYVKVSNHDGTPLGPNDREIIVRHGYSREDEVYKVHTHKLDKNGIAKLEYYTPVNVTNATALRIEAEYKDLKERISPIPAAVSFSNNFLQITLETDQPIVNLDVDVAINCTEPMKYLNYVLMGRGDVLITNTFYVDNRKQFQFHFTATHAMVPVSHLIVSYIRPDGELIADAIDIEVDDRQLQNFIDIQINTVESYPNMDVELTVRAQQNSYVGIMAVDENVALLRSGYDLNQQQVRDELKRFDVAEGTPYAFIRKDSKSHFLWKPGASNPHTAIYESGADLLTNAKVNRTRPTLEDIYLRPVFYGSSTVKPDRGFGLPLQSVTRPPLAGPYAFSRIPRPVWNKPKVYLKQEIADTWLFSNFSSGYEGKTSLRRRIPNSLNNWLITGFSLDPLHGLGLITQPKKLKVTKQFVVSLDLPYSVQRGEILAVPVVVYNHMGQDIYADVTLHNPEQKFDFAEVSNEVNATKKVELYRRKRLTVKRNSGASVSFMITPLRKGRIEIKVTANSVRSQDVAVKQLTVVAEGEPEYYTKSLLIDLRNTNVFKSNISFTMPPNAVEGSQKIEVSVLGDLFGATMINLDSLTRLPTGCGEQNLVNFFPNIIVLQYLRAKRQLTPAIELEAIKNLEIGYQKELSYRRTKDGSFSPFGSRDTSGSVWLTANVALALQQASQFIYVDESIIIKALDWLVGVQGKNGSFYEAGNLIYRDVQDNSGNSLALTAFTLLAFLENQRGSFNNYTNAINKGLDYLARNIDEEESTYSLAICSYTLQLAKHTSKQSALNLLDSRAKSKGNMKWWAKDTPANESKNPWTHLPRSIDIETTSYALLAFLEAGLDSDSIPVLHWLINQQNNVGGFTSSQDTIVGLHALQRVMLRFSTSSNMQIEYAYKPHQTEMFSINRNSEMILQSATIDSKTRLINVTAQGSGVALFKVSYQYNSNVTGPWPMFTLDPQVDKNSNRHHLQVSICTAFVSRNLSESIESNMAVMEVNLPSGFTADIDSLPSLEVSQNVQKVETSHGLTRVILYFNNITRLTEYCPTISAFRTHKVAKQKPVPVIIYDYYDTSRRARVFYRGPSATLCDICEGEDCGDICEIEAESFQANSPEDSNTGASKDREGRNSKGAAKSLFSKPSFVDLIILLGIVVIVNN